MQCLFAGYRAVNTPVGGQAALQQGFFDNSLTESGRNAIIEVSRNRREVWVRSCGYGA